MPKSYLFHSCLALLLGLAASATAAGPDLTGAQPLSLDQAVSRALESNLNLKIHREDVTAAEGAALAAEGRFDTRLSASLASEDTEVSAFLKGYDGHEKNSVFSAGLEKQFAAGTRVSLGMNSGYYDYADSDSFTDPAYASAVSLGISQPLLKGFGRDVQSAEIEAAQKRLAASTFEVDGKAADLAARVKSAYWDLVYALQDIEVKQLSLKLAHKLLEETDAKIKAGKLAEIDVYQPQSEVARREESLIAAEQAVGTAEDELKLLLNSDRWSDAFRPTDTPSTAPIQLDPQTILTHALDNRPDLKAADLTVEAARLQRKAAEDNLRPDLSLAGGVGYGGAETSYGDALDAAADDPQTSWQIGLEFSIPLDNSRAKGELAQARAAHGKAGISADLLRQEIKKSVRTTVRNVELAAKAVDATRKTSLATLKRLEAEQTKFAAGRATTLDVLTAQDAYSQALSQENRTIVTYAKHLAEIDRIQGKISFTASR